MVETNAAVVTGRAGDLENPNSASDLLRKHEELKSGAETAVKRKRGRPSNADRAARGGPDVATAPPDIFTPESVRPFTDLPFAVASIWTRSESFYLQDEESKTLAHQGSIVANLYAGGWNPRAVALVMFAFGFATLAAKKTMTYLGEQKEKQGAENA